MAHLNSSLFRMLFDFFFFPCIRFFVTIFYHFSLSPNKLNQFLLSLLNSGGRTYTNWFVFAVAQAAYDDDGELEKGLCLISSFPSISLFFLCSSVCVYVNSFHQISITTIIDFLMELQSSDEK